MCPQEHKGYAVTTLSVINKKATALNATASALMFLRAHGRESVSVCLEALMFLCSYVLRVSGISHNSQTKIHIAHHEKRRIMSFDWATH